MDEEATATGRNHGEQPLDELMKRWHLTNHIGYCSPLY